MSPAQHVLRALRRGDVLLIEGNTRVSMAIKYLTQSTWSHAALYVGPLGGASDPSGELPELVEADIREGVRAVPLARYADFHTRICRPVGLDEATIDRVVEYAVSRLGHKYDLQNLLDLARYLLPLPPIPVRLRRRLIGFGSGEPTDAAPGAPA